jgi:hypothetical protein
MSSVDEIFIQKFSTFHIFSFIRAQRVPSCMSGNGVFAMMRKKNHHLASMLRKDEILSITGETCIIFFIIASSVDTFFSYHKFKFLVAFAAKEKMFFSDRNWLSIHCILGC